MRGRPIPVDGVVASLIYFFTHSHRFWSSCGFLFFFFHVHPRVRSYQSSHEIRILRFLICDRVITHRSTHSCQVNAAVAWLYLPCGDGFFYYSVPCFWFDFRSLGPWLVFVLFCALLYFPVAAPFIFSLIPFLSLFNLFSFFPRNEQKKKLPVINSSLHRYPPFVSNSVSKLFSDFLSTTWK